MYKNREKMGKLLGLAGWGIGWGISWGTLSVYQNSVAFGFAIHPSAWYWVWRLNILSFFVLGWLIAGLSTGGMLRISSPNFKLKYFISFVLLWGIIGLILGLILGQLFLLARSVGIETIYFLYLACFYIFLLPAGFGLAGFIGWSGMTRILDQVTPSTNKQYSWKGKRMLALGLAAGVLPGLIISYFVAAWLGPWAWLIGGLVGGVIAGGIGNAAISKYFLQPQ